MARRVLYHPAMRRLLPLTLLALTLFGGVAVADRDRDHRRDRREHREHREHRDSRPVVRDHRHHSDYRAPVRHNRRVVRGGSHVYVNNGRYVFRNGYHRPYVRPVIHRRYYDYRLRPSIVVEHYDPVPGYIWVQGRWDWNGVEWIWSSGHFAPDPRVRVWYDDGSFDY